MKRLLAVIVCILPTFQLAGSVSCYDCKADGNTCNVGECRGASCIKMETSNLDTGRTAVYKSCSTDYEETQCKETGIGSKLITRCACETHFCNGDKNLIAAGLQSDASARQSALPLVISFSFLSVLSMAFLILT